MGGSLGPLRGLLALAPTPSQGPLQQGVWLCMDGNAILPWRGPGGGEDRGRGAQPPL